MALSTPDGQLRDKAIAPALQSLQVRIGTVFRPGALVAHRIGSKLLEVPLSGSPRTDLIICGTYVGKFIFTASSTDDGFGGALDPVTGLPQVVQYEPGSTGWFATGTAGNQITDAMKDEACWAYDDDTLYATSAGSTLSVAGRVLGVAPNGHPHAGRVAVYIPGVPNDWAFTNSADAVTSFANLLAGTANGEGASLVGIEDAGSFTAATTVEAALAEIYQDLKSAQAHILVPIYALREVNATGDVTNTAGGGGVLSSDTTPVMRGDANNSAEIFWTTGNADPIGFSTSLPPDLDDTANVLVELEVSSGATDAATFGVASSWNGGAEVTDSASDALTLSATPHTITATIAAADVPASSKRLTLRLTPPAHATDTISVYSVRILYKRKLRTS